MNSAGNGPRISLVVFPFSSGYRKLVSVSQVLLCNCLLSFSMPAMAEVIVNITGVEGPLKTSLQESLTLIRRTNLQEETSASIRTLYQRSLAEIGEVLQSKGYYDYSVKDQLRQEGENWIANFVVTPGEPVIVRSLSTGIAGEGRDDHLLVRAMEEFPLTAGMIFDHSLYESGKRRLENIASDRGYFDGQFTVHSVSIDRTVNAASITLNFDSGVRYRFGEVEFPDTVIDHDILVRHVPFTRNSPYDANLLIQFSQNLRNSQYFHEAIVSAPRENATDYQIPVHVMLTPRPRNNIRFGAGYGTDSGPRLVASWDNHYFNRRGHRIDSDLKLSRNWSEVLGAYTMPDFRQSGAELDLMSSLSTKTTDTSISDAFRFGLRQNRIRWGWNENVSLVYQFESSKVAGVGNNSNLLTPEVSYWRSVTDSPVYTTAGYRLNFTLKGALKGALSNMSFIQAVFNGKYITPAGEHGRWIVRGELGASHVPVFNELPASLRFFAGGDNSIRGFDFQQLGPVNDAGEIIGGRYLAIASIEHERDLHDKWGVAVFSDFGNAFNDLSDRFVYSVGAGLRWKTIVGLLRIDIAAGVSEDKVPYRLHINLGPDL